MSRYDLPCCPQLVTSSAFFSNVACWNVLRGIGRKGHASGATMELPSRRQPSMNLVDKIGLDRGRAAVIADGECHRHRVRGPGQIGVMRLRVERVALGPRGLDPHLQVHAIDHPCELERPKPFPFEGAGRDGRGEGADLEGHRLGGGIDPVAGAPQGEAGIKIKVIGVWLVAEVDLKLGAERAEGHARPEAE